MSQVTSIMMMHIRDKWMFRMTPFMILGSSFAVNFLCSIIFKGITTGGLASIYIYMLVAGIISLTQTFPFTISLNVRRTDYFLGTALAAAVLCAIFAALLLVLSRVEQATQGWGVRLHFFHLPYLGSGTLMAQLWWSFVLLLHMFFLGFAISSVYRRFGRGGMLLVSLTGLLLLTIVTLFLSHRQLWGDIFHWFNQQSASGLASWLAPFILIYALISFLLLRKSIV